MVKLRAVDFYKWPFIAFIVPVWAGTIVLMFSPYILQSVLPTALTGSHFFRGAVDLIPYFGLGYFFLVVLSVILGWENFLTRRLFRRIQKSMEHERE